MDHNLQASERALTLLKRFRRYPVPAVALEDFLGRYGFFPTEVRDFGEVPSFYHHFEELDTTIELYIEPTLNDHYSDDMPRRIEWISFCDTNFVHGQHYRLGQVDGDLMQYILRGITDLIHNSSEYLYNGPVDADTQLILAHGASVPMDSEFMTDIAAQVASHDIRVVRFEFPYMRQHRQDGRKRAPNSTNVLEKCWMQVLEAHGGKWKNVIGGKSIGGRIATHIAARIETYAQVRGVVCLGYPFHPAGKPEKPRIEHLQGLTTPTLIVQGTRDRFGCREEVETYSLSSSIDLVWLEDGDHSFKPRKRSIYTESEHRGTAAKAIADFVSSLP